MDLKAARQLKARCAELDLHNLLCSDNQDLDLIIWCKILSGGQMKTFYLQQMQLGVSKRDLVHSLKFRWLDHWLAPLEWLKQQALQRTRLAPEKIVPCPLGVNTEKFESLTLSQAQAREDFALPENLFLFGFLGRTDPGKGLHTLIEAFNQVAENDPDVGLLVVSAFPKEGGEHWEYCQKIHRQKETSPYRERIFFRPFTDQVEKVFKCMDVFVMASVAETVGMVTIEAMLSRVPVLGANQAGTPELLDFGRVGRLFEVENPQDLALKMRSLKEGREESLRQADQAFTRAKSLYSSDQMCHTIQRRLL